MPLTPKQKDQLLAGLEAGTLMVDTAKTMGLTEPIEQIRMEMKEAYGAQRIQDLISQARPTRNFNRQKVFATSSDRLAQLSERLRKQVGDLPSDTDEATLMKVKNDLVEAIALLAKKTQ